ncbi:MAG: anti-sigma factor antagonist [Caldilineae bacterium]|nr:MAG: anti-sigma factor antagonist [Caldilineae bacterium]
MNIQVTPLDQDGNIIGLTFEGRLDAASREMAKAELHRQLATPATTLVIDMSGIPFVDSSGLSALVSGLRVAREQGKDIVLVHPNKQAQMIFDLTMMDRVFSIYPSMEVALEHLHAS